MLVTSGCCLLGINSGSIPQADIEQSSVCPARQFLSILNMVKVCYHTNIQSKTTDQALEALEALCTQIKKGSNDKTSFGELELLIDEVITNGTLFQAWAAS